MKHKCKICGTELPEKNADCPECGHLIETRQNVYFSAVGNKNKVKFIQSDLHFTERGLAVQDVHDRQTAGMLGLVGAAIYAAQKKKFLCNAQWAEIARVEYPLKDKYGSLMSSVKDDKGLLIELTSGEKFVAYESFKKNTASIVELFRSQGIPVD